MSCICPYFNSVVTGDSHSTTSNHRHKIIAYIVVVVPSLHKLWTFVSQNVFLFFLLYKCSACS